MLCRVSILDSMNLLIRDPWLLSFLRAITLCVLRRLMIESSLLHVPARMLNQI